MSTSLAIPIVLLVIIGLALGTLVNFAFGFLAIPIVAMLLAGFLVTSDAMNRRRRIHKLQQFRKSSRTEKVDFTEQDKRTVV
jgi:hypothetical protein